MIQDETSQEIFYLRLLFIIFQHIQNYSTTMNRNQFRRKVTNQQKKSSQNKINLLSPPARLLSENRQIQEHIDYQKKKLKINQQKLLRLKAEQRKILEDKQRYKYRLAKFNMQYQQMKKHMGQPQYFIQNNEYLSQYLQQLVIQKSTQQSYDPNDPDRMTYQQLLELGEKIGKVSKGLTVEQLQNLKRVIYSRSKSHNPDKCSVCCQQFKQNQKLVELICKHFYHEQCIIGWLKQENICPLCKSYLV